MSLINRERLEWMIRLFQEDIQSRRDWCARGWISEETRDHEIAGVTGRMSIPLAMLPFSV